MYVRQIADLVGLQDWRITVAQATEDENNMAECRALAIRHTAVIAFNANWRTWTRVEFADTVLHELLHCHMQPVEQSLREMRDRFLQYPVTTIVESLHSSQYEAVIDAIAANWSRMMPQPMFMKE